MSHVENSTHLSQVHSDVLGYRVPFNNKTLALSAVRRCIAGGFPRGMTHVRDASPHGR